MSHSSLSLFLSTPSASRRMEGKYGWHTLSRWDFLRHNLQLKQHVIRLLCVQADYRHLLLPVSGFQVTYIITDTDSHTFFHIQYQIEYICGCESHWALRVDIYLKDEIFIMTAVQANSLNLHATCHADVQKWKWVQPVVALCMIYKDK